MEIVLRPQGASAEEPISLDEVPPTPRFVLSWCQLFLVGRQLQATTTAMAREGKPLAASEHFAARFHFVYADPVAVSFRSDAA